MSFGFDKQPPVAAKKAKTDNDIEGTSVSSKLNKLKLLIDDKVKEVEKKEEEVKEKDMEVKEKAKEVKEKDKEVEQQAKEVEKKEEETKDASHSLEAMRKLIGLQKEKARLQEEKYHMQKEKARLLEEKARLQEEKYRLLKEQAHLQEEHTALERNFLTGLYFGATSDYWKMMPINVGQNAIYSKIKWENFHRPAEVADEIVARHYVSESYQVTKPYKETREGAQDKTKPAAPSNSSSTSSVQQKKKNVRDKVWPTDVFGNPADMQPIAHLLPGGQHDHKEWVLVAAAVVGLKKNDGDAADTWFNQLKKVTRGFRETAESRSKTQGTGVVHFVPNKLRMNYQKEVWDGENCMALMVPILRLEDAKNWKGESYKALFIVGKPDSPGDPEGREQVKNVYANVHLHKEGIIEANTVKDASKEQIELARETLCHAVLAMRDMIARLSEDEIAKLCPRKNSQGLKDAIGFATNAECILPKNVDESPPQSKRRPLCVVEFAGNRGDHNRHPSPDPLLLAYKAACVWAKMTGKRLLTNGATPDPYPDMTEEDFAAEWAYYEARYPSHKTPETWQELATGLGQPNGYESGRQWD